MSRHNHTGLDEAASVASNTMQAVRTGKAIFAAAKGAAAGGPYGAAIGAALSARKHIGKIAAAALVLLALPLLFILLLPGIIFGSLTDSGASGVARQPILNDNAAITENVNQAAFAINQILGEGIENVQERIANDFAGTGGDHYEVVNPYEGNLISNANLFISQYCAAKNLDFAAISLTDMERILRAGLTHLYSFSRTMEVRTVPAEEDGEEDDYVDGFDLDVDRLIYGEIMVNWPTKVLCKEDCKGICRKCGVNLNLQTCDCQKTELDPRMAAIQDIFNKFKEV